MIVRYRWALGVVERKEFERASKTKLYIGGRRRMNAKPWSETRSEAIRRSIEWCDREAAGARRAALAWDAEAKLAFVELVKELAGVHEYEYDDGVGTEDDTTGGVG